MSQFRSTADILDLSLRNAGEVTSGVSPYETMALDYLNRVHYTLVAGGTIPIGKDQTVEIDEVWPWAKSKLPLIVELQPKFSTGSVTFSQGSESGTFSSAPTVSLRGWYIRLKSGQELLRIAQHTASSTSFELDSAYPDTSASGMAFDCVKLDYDLIPDYIVVNPGNQYFQFQKVSGTTLTATLTQGVYTPSDLISHVATVATTAAGGPTITGSYSDVTRKFSLVSNLAGPTSFIIVGNGSQAGFSVHRTLGYDDETSSSSGTQTSNYVLGGICRIVEPFKVHKGFGGSVFGVDAETFQRDYPTQAIEEGIPDRFAIVREQADGIITVRFNRYPVEKTRIEIENVPIPRDLKDNSTSVPLVPRKHIDVLEDAATFYLMINKSDDRANIYASLLQGKLKAMIAQHRGALVRVGTNFGQIIPRREQLSRVAYPRFNPPYTDVSQSSGTVQTLVQETLAYSDFAAASLTSTVTARTLASNRTLFSLIVKHSTAFAGSGISSVVLDIGIVGDSDKFITSFSVSQAVSATAQDSTLTVYYPGVATAITVTATAIGANLSALTQGSVDIYFLESAVS